ncbi:hypothetical protein BGX29_005864 [Mortierella sp. GBA35]|nr:hypothetical protein BGX29_005864 [Mortierella sp. GBA35]KAG0219506.1 hypothetical protein BGX33_002451 [Mortierella sp. NVP41]
MQFSTLIALSVATSMAVLSAMAAPSPVCPKMCPAVFQPICGKLQSGETKTFGNACELSVFNCENPTAKFTVVAETTCEDLTAPTCEIMCTMAENPVCAKSKDGKTKTFSNSCFLKVYNCQNPTSKFELIANAKCPVAAPVCNKACTKDYRPVCAQIQGGETQTFGNTCEMNVYKCEHPTEKVELVANGVCPAAPQKRADAPVCNKACNKLYAPVCAKLQSGETKTFGNKCMMNVFNCENPTEKVELVANTACPASVCNKACNKLYAPVCAKLQSGETKTFGNKCTMDVFKCENPAEKVELVANGACPAAPQKRAAAAPACRVNCPLVYEPLCAKLTNGELLTFGNSCELSLFKCHNPAAAFTVSEGPCM